MKYLKSFESVELFKSDMDKLLSHILQILIKYDFDYKNYSNHNNWEIEFFKNKQFMFMFTSTRNNELEIIISDYFDKNPEKEFNIIKFLQNIKGLVTLASLPEFKFKMISPVNDIIKQITIENIEFFKDATQYNL